MAIITRARRKRFVLLQSARFLETAGEHWAGMGLGKDAKKFFGFARGLRDLADTEVPKVKRK